MLPLISGFLYAGVAVVEGASVLGARSLIQGQAETLFTLPQYSTNGTARVADIETKRGGWLYGPSIAGNTSFYPTGALGDAAAEAGSTAAFAFRK